MGKKATGKNEKRKNTPFVGDKPPPARKKKKKRTGSSAGAEEEAEPGRELAGLGQGSAAARPLDGGVLTRWGARAPARGPATAQRTARSAFLARGCSVAAVLAAATEKGERESKSRNG